MTHSPRSSSERTVNRSLWCPRALEGRKLPRPIADAKLFGVEGRPEVGEATRLLAGDEPPPEYKDPGRVSLEGDRPAGGSGEEDRGGCPDPVYFFWVSVKEKIACDRED